MAQAKYQLVFGGIKVADTFHHLFVDAMNASRLTLLFFFFALATTLTSCDVIGGIFKAGAYTGIIAVFIIVVVLFFIVNKMRGPRS